jgi:hypothetical protein
MNQRIKELATEARLLTGWPVGEVEYQKFAELIVRKCADIGERYADGNYEVPNQILEYFGMEEE